MNTQTLEQVIDLLDANIEKWLLFEGKNIDEFYEKKFIERNEILDNSFSEAMIFLGSNYSDEEMMQIEDLKSDIIIAINERI